MSEASGTVMISPPGQLGAPPQASTSRSPSTRTHAGTTARQPFGHSRSCCTSLSCVTGHERSRTRVALSSSECGASCPGESAETCQVGQVTSTLSCRVSQCQPPSASSPHQLSRSFSSSLPCPAVTPPLLTQPTVAYLTRALGCAAALVAACAFLLSSRFNLSDLRLSALPSTTAPPLDTMPDMSVAQASRSVVKAVLARVRPPPPALVSRRRLLEST